MMCAPQPAGRPDRTASNDAAGQRICVSILVVGYNSRGHLGAALGAIAGACARTPCEVLFVNNGDDDSEAFVAASHPEVRMLPSCGNVGFAGGNNYLASHARGEWLLLLNPDTRLYPGAIDTLLDAAAKRPEFSVLGGMTVGANGADIVSSSLHFPTIATIARGIWGGQPRRPASRDAGQVIPVDAVSGGFMLVSRGLWDRLDGFDEGFFLYAEELDFARRATDSGARIGTVPAARMYHDIGSGAARSPVRTLYGMRGAAHYYHKHFSPAYAWTCVGLHWIAGLARFVAGGLLGWKGRRYRKLREAFAPVVLRPWTWVRGYDSPGADPRRH